MWFDIAVENGDDDARASRDLAAERMSPGAVAEARRRAQRCLASGYADCE
jgi:hypothetical protein